MIIVLLLVCAVIIVFGVKNKNRSAVMESENAKGDGLSTAFEDSQLPRLLELGSVTCVPCKMMAPIIDDIEATYSGQLAVEFIDIAKNGSAGEEYGVRIIPTQIFFTADGKELFRHEGFFSKEDIIAKWQELGFDFIATKQIAE